MNKGNHKKQQHPAGAEANQKRSAAVAVEESLGGLEEKYDEVQKLIDIGKEKGYLLYDEVSDLLPPEISASAEDLDDLFSAFGTAGIEVIDTDDQSFAGLDKVAGAKKFEEQPEDIELDLTPGALEKTNDPVRMYLREMGTVPLLTRDGEVEIAKRIERGQMTAERESDFKTVICPRSMRFAISTSPSRVSNGTVPISRKYMRTGSLVFSRAPGVRSSSISSGCSSNFFAPATLSSPAKLWSSVSITSIPAVPNAENRSSRSSADALISGGSRSLTSS